MSLDSSSASVPPALSAPPPWGLLGTEVVPGFMSEAYLWARDSGSLVLCFLAVVIVAPISEEVAFRGFLFRGLSASWLGASGAIIATSAAWAAMHVQYDTFTLAQ